MKRALQNLALAAASVAFMLGVLEAGLRLAHDVPLTSTVNFLSQALDLVRVNSAALDFDRQLGWRLKERSGVPGSGFTTGPQGIRTNGKPLGTLPTGAILAVGDSFTAGSGVKDEETWPAQLERRLGRPVLNAAAGAWGVDQMVLRAELLAPMVKPSALIVGILAQDSFRNSYDVYGGGAKPWFALEDGRAALKGVPVERLEGTAHSLGPVRRVLGHSYLVHWTMTRPALISRWIDHGGQYHRVMSDKDGVRVSCALMERLKAFRSKHGAEIVVVMLWGAQESIEPAPYWYGAEVVECARRAGHSTIDLHAPLHAIHRDDPQRFARLWIDEGGMPGHPSAEGHALTAELIWRLLSGGAPAAGSGGQG